MEDNNNIDTTVVPETIDPKVPYIELDPESELNFVEGNKRILFINFKFAVL